MKTKFNWRFWSALTLIGLFTACALVPEMEEAPKDDGPAAPAQTNSPAVTR
jgi:hypothetical protein